MSAAAPFFVKHVAPFHLLDVAVPGEVTMSFDPADPACVVMSFVAPPPFHRESTEWVMARRLLIDGIDSAWPVGLGDVKVYRDSDRVAIRLSSPEGRAEVRIDRAALALFLAETAVQVPPGTDGVHGPESAAIHRGINAWLAEIFGVTS